MIDWKIPGLRRRAQAAGNPAVGAEPSNASYSRLALRLERDLALDERGRSVLVAAADDDAVGVEAVTELAWHLAAEQGHSVLMIDGAFGKGTLSAAFGISGRKGLMELLDARSVDAAALSAVAIPTRHEGIFLLSRGHGDNGRLIPARSENVRQLLATACAGYDFVLVQGSVLDKSSRSVAFGGFVDAALLVAVEGRSLVHDIERAQGILNESGAERVGLVIASRAATRQPGAA